MADESGALHGVRIVDLTDERAIYGAKLLADLGADVVRPEPPEGDPLRKRGPHLEGASEAESSLWHTFFASNRRCFAVDPSDAAGRAMLGNLVDRADIVLTTTGSFGVAEADLIEARKRRPRLVVIETSSFGPAGPWRDYLAPDLVAGALGGSVATTGDVDTPPLKTFGELNFMVSGAYVAIAALSALYRARESGLGQTAHVPVHECIASCLEHVLMFYCYHDHLATADGPALERRGSLHWSNAYVVMQAQGGSIMVTPAPNVDAQLAWLVEVGAEEDLAQPKYQGRENRTLFVPRLMEVLRSWIGTREVESLFNEAQSRHAPYGWVLPIEKVAENPQLQARDWWVPYRVGEAEIRGPGAPYRFSETPWRIRASVGSGAGSGGHSGAGSGPSTDTQAILAEIDWEDNR